MKSGYPCTVLKNQREPIVFDVEPEVVPLSAEHQPRAAHAAELPRTFGRVLPSDTGVLAKRWEVEQHPQLVEAWRAPGLRYGYGIAKQEGVYQP